MPASLQLRYNLACIPASCLGKIVTVPPPPSRRYSWIFHGNLPRTRWSMWVVRKSCESRQLWLIPDIGRIIFDECLLFLEPAMAIEMGRRYFKFIPLICFSNRDRSRYKCKFAFRDVGNWGQLSGIGDRMQLLFADISECRCFRLTIRTNRISSYKYQQWLEKCLLWYQKWSVILDICPLFQKIGFSHEKYWWNGQMFRKIANTCLWRQILYIHFSDFFIPIATSIILYSFRLQFRITGIE